MSFKAYYFDYLLTESRRFPISVRNKRFKKLEARLSSDTRFKAAALELWQQFNTNPDNPSLGFSVMSKIDNLHGRWYKLPLRVPGLSADYRFLGFEPNSCPGLIIWDWVGTHEEYNRVWKDICTGVPGGWAATRDNQVPTDIPPWMAAACKAAREAKGMNLAMGKKEYDRRLKTLNQPASGKIPYGARGEIEKKLRRKTTYS
jgi:hypothetical protein